MQNSNECKRNFVAVYDGSSSVEDLKAKFCSTVANDVMLRTGLGVIRMWADEGSRNSRFQMLFTSFQERKTLLSASPFQFVKWYKSQNLLIFSSCRAVTEGCCQTSYVNIQNRFYSKHLWWAVICNTVDRPTRFKTKETGTSGHDLSSHIIVTFVWSPGYMHIFSYTSWKIIQLWKFLLIWSSQIIFSEFDF